jgi:hypothetical protein
LFDDIDFAGVGGQDTLFGNGLLLGG